MPIIKSFGYQLTNVNFAQVAAASYDLFVTEAAPLQTNGAILPQLTSANVSQLKSEGRTVLGYVDIGVTDDLRYYWQPSWTSNGRDTGTPTSAAPTWLQGSVPIDFTGDGVPDGRIVDYTDPTWQQIVIDQAVALVRDRGYSGVFLDDIGRYFDYGTAKGNVTAAADAMIAFVARVKAAITAISPAAVLVTNTNPYILTDNSTGDAASSVSFQFIKAVDFHLIENQTTAVIDYARQQMPGEQLLILDNTAGANISAAEGWQRGVYLQVPSNNYDVFAPVVYPATAGADVLTGGDGPNRIDGLGGNDQIVGGNGADVLIGGDGDDVLTGGNGDDTIDGGAGTDTAVFERTSMVDLGLQGSRQDTNRSGSDLLVSIENLVGSTFDDTFYGDGGVNQLTDARNGNDAFYGLGGDDILAVSRSGSSAGTSVQLSGGAGADTITFLGGARLRDTVTLNGDAGADTITVSSPASASVSGGDGDDRVVIDTRGGSYAVTLGAGTDTLALAYIRGAGLSAITVTDFVAGAAGDRLDVTTWVTTAAISRYNASLGPFEEGHLLLAPAGADTLLFYDSNGSGDYPVPLIRFQNTAATSFTSANFISGDLGFAPRYFVPGTPGNDQLTGGVTPDFLLPGRGNNVIDGGDGADTLVLIKARAAYSAFTINGQTYLVAKGEADRTSNIETIRFANTTQSAANATVGASGFDTLRYTASFADLRAQYGTTNATAALTHYLSFGFAEGRDAYAFDPLAYIASHRDLRAAYGTNAAEGSRHYIAAGAAEGRQVTFDPLAYIASYADLRAAYGVDGDAGARHYIQAGAGEGRAATFDPLSYLAANSDVLVQVGNDTTAATIQYIRFGSSRPTSGFDALSYVASYNDLIRAFGTDTRGAVRHYVDYGYAEGRAPTFDALRYGASYVDLARSFGTDADGLSRHFIQTGFGEGRLRDAGFDAVGYLLTYSDLAAAKLGKAGALNHWLIVGADEGRVGDATFGREQTSHALIDGMTGTIDSSGDRDWFEFDVNVDAGARQISVHLDNVSVAGTLELHRSNGELVKTATADANGDVTLDYIASAADTYYLVVAASTPAGTGTYAIDYTVI